MLAVQGVHMHALCREPRLYIRHAYKAEGFRTAPLVQPLPRSSSLSVIFHTVAA